MESLLSSSVLAGHWGGHLIVTIVVISTHCATVWGHHWIGMIRVMVVSTDACGACLHCQSSLSSWLLLVVVSGDEDDPHVVLVMFVSSSYQSWLSCPFVVVALHWHQASHVIIPSLFSWYYYVHCHCSMSLLLSYHAATCQSCCFIITDTISSLLWYCTEADCH